METLHVKLGKGGRKTANMNQASKNVELNTF